MTVVWVLAAAAAVVLVSVALRAREHGPRLPEEKPGQGMERLDRPPDGLVSIAVMGYEESLVARGLLETAGFAVATTSADDTATPYRRVPRAQRIWVEEARVDEARALLSDGMAAAG
jgi:hypothetical protein